MSTSCVPVAPRPSLTLFFQKITPNFDNFIISPFFVEVICVVAQKGSKYKTNLEIRTTLNLPSNLRNQEMCFKVSKPLKVHKINQT